MQHRNFQLFIAGQLISLIGTWMQTTAQLWLVYKLTGSAALLGVFGFASQVPMLFLSSIGGYVGDRYDRHRGVIATQTISMILAFALAGLTLTKLINEWELIVVAFLVGIVNAFDVPIRQAFLVHMVGKEDLPNAIALNSSIFNGARVAGPAIAGFAIAWVGEGWCFFLNGLSFVAVIVALLMMRIERREIKPSTDSQPRDGGLRNDVHGRATDRRVARRRRRETDWSAIHADSVWIAGAAREPDFHRASGHETERNASRAGGLGRIWPVEPGRPSGRLVGGGCLGYVRAGNPRCYRSGSKIHGRKNRVDFGAQRRERADRISGSGIS